MQGITHTGHLTDVTTGTSATRTSTNLMSHSKATLQLIQHIIMSQFLDSC